MKISKKVKNNKKAKTVINATVHKTKILLRIGNLTVKLSKVESIRAHRTLGRALMIQDTTR